jgi:hypothetical protein
MPRVAPWDLPVVSQPRRARTAARAEGISRPRRIWEGESMGVDPKPEVRNPNEIPKSKTQIPINDQIPIPN